MAIKVIINGANGRMGSKAVDAINNDNRFTLVAQLSRSDDLAASIQTTNADVVVDLTNADSVSNNTRTIIEAGARPVIGTSGLKADEIAVFSEMANRQKLGGVIAPNFSIGAVLMMQFAKQAAQYLPQAEIIEAHHPGKLDSPSGTAVRTAELMAQYTAQADHSAQANAREVVAGARGADYQNTKIHAIRLPGFLAKQQVIFGSLGETLTIEHNSIDRQCFMPGILLACEKVMALDKLVCGLEHIL